MSDSTKVLKKLWEVGVQRQLAHIPGDTGFMLFSNFHKVQVVLATPGESVDVYS